MLTRSTVTTQQQVNFIGADNHVHELVYSDRWYHNGDAWKWAGWILKHLQQ
jgi:hypothetical protein